ncbi:MAG: alpha-amylase [Candidatus Parcubacteria bacterium]|nr:MAG: alpha-amylase [Candidatus Parcubacteria bacterium]
MTSICFYFKVHQPFRIKNFTIFNIGNDSDYFDDEKNKFYLDRIVEKCYLPTLKIFYELIKETNFRFKFSVGITGTLMEQLQLWHPEVIDWWQKISSTGCLEFTGETYYHSLSSLYSKEEFKFQINYHKKLIKEFFSQEPIIFSNTELIYFDDLEIILEKLNFKGIITEGVDRILEWRSPNFVYHTPNQKLKVLLRNYNLSDDISFRFSNKNWEGWPLTADKFLSWLNQIKNNSEVINLFMDFETFGEHQWKETGIFDFITDLILKITEENDLEFNTLSEAIKKYPSRGKWSSIYPITWADTERDLSAWLENEMQKDTLERLYNLEKNVLNKNDINIISQWRKLQTADHFYYMCTKWFNDGDVHKYFNPYESPYIAYICYRNVLEDLYLKLNLK